MTNKSLWEIHNEYVKELLERGEKVLQPKFGNPRGTIWGYIKDQNPHKDAGIIHKDKDGTFDILCDMCQYGIMRLKLDDIGLCDAKCWYEWMTKNKCVEKLKCYDLRKCDQTLDKLDNPDKLEKPDRKDGPDLKNIDTKDLIEELLTREKVYTIEMPRRFSNAAGTGCNAVGIAKIIIVEN